MATVYQDQAAGEPEWLTVKPGLFGMKETFVSLALARVRDDREVVERTVELAASSLKAALDRDWDDLAARDDALAVALGLLDRVEAFIAGQAGDEAAAAAAAACQVRDQDMNLAGPAPALRRSVARDRRISIEDSQMRHGRKSRSVLSGGYKRHIMRDLGTGMVPAVGITPANVPEASSVSPAISRPICRPPG